MAKRLTQQGFLGLTGLASCAIAFSLEMNGCSVHPRLELD